MITTEFKMSEHDVGYLKRAVEDLTSMLKKHMEKEDKCREVTNKRLERIEQELNIYKTVYRGVKWFMAIVILILTLRFGDIPKLFGN